MAQYYEGIGRRKESTARVRLTTGSGKFTVNDKDFAAFFTRMGDFEDIMRPFGAVGQEAAKYDVSVLVNGGGTTRTNRIGSSWNCPRPTAHQRRVDFRFAQEGLAHP